MPLTKTDASEPLTFHAAAPAESKPGACDSEQPISQPKKFAQMYVLGDDDEPIMLNRLGIVMGLFDPDMSDIDAAALTVTRARCHER